MCVGTELVTGLTQDMNALFFSQKLVHQGVFPKTVLFVPDDKYDIARVFRFLLQDTEIRLIIICGGLGPTDDDFTKEVIAEILGYQLYFDEGTWQKIRQFYQKIRGIEPPENNKKQALVPQGAVVLTNELGTAPGLKIEVEGKQIFVVPGVPREAEFFWSFIQQSIHEEERLPFYRSKILKFCGIGESQLAIFLQPLLRSLPADVRFAFLPKYGEIWFYLYAYQVDEEKRRKMDEHLDLIARSQYDFLFSPYGDTLEEAIGKLMQAQNLTLAIAESCTGGLLGDRITNIPGSSRYFDRGYIVYSNRAKVEELHVPQNLLETRGAVSEEVALYLAQGARENAQADIGMGITGIAGPQGGSEEKPVGLVYVAIADATQAEVKKYQFGGDRLMNKRFTSQAALSMLFTFLRRRKTA